MKSDSRLHEKEYFGNMHNTLKAVSFYLLQEAYCIFEVYWAPLKQCYLSNTLRAQIPPAPIGVNFGRWRELGPAFFGAGVFGGRRFWGPAFLGAGVFGAGVNGTVFRKNLRKTCVNF